MIHFIDARGRSSLIKEVYYDDRRMELTVVLTYGVFVYEDVRSRYFEMFSEVDSLGKYYLQFIKNKLKMAKAKNTAPVPAPEPKKSKADYGCNRSSDKKRFIKMRVKLNVLRKDWFFIGEKNDVYADLTLSLLPDGTVDQYGNLGMITQDVPRDIVEAEKELEKKDRTLGPILGNGFEFKPSGYHEDTVAKVTEDTQEVVDDLPF